MYRLGVGANVVAMGRGRVVMAVRILIIYRSSLGLQWRCVSDRHVRRICMIALLIAVLVSWRSLGVMLLLILMLRWLLPIIMVVMVGRLPIAPVLLSRHSCYDICGER